LPAAAFGGNIPHYQQEANPATDMPNIQSAKKRLRQNIVRRVRNRAIKSVIRTQCRKVREAVDGGDVQKAETEFRLAAKKVDQAGAHNIIHRNAAARIKSRLAAKIKAAKQAKAPGAGT
jgi:small subunit ribosomal protein S20